MFIKVDNDNNIDDKNDGNSNDRGNTYNSSSDSKSNNSDNNSNKGDTGGHNTCILLFREVMIKMKTLIMILIMTILTKKEMLIHRERVIYCTFI